MIGQPCKKLCLKKIPFKIFLKFSLKSDRLTLVRDPDKDPNWAKILDPYQDRDPNRMYLDPQHCSKVTYNSSHQMTSHQSHNIVHISQLESLTFFYILKENVSKIFFIYLDSLKLFNLKSREVANLEDYLQKRHEVCVTTRKYITYKYF